MPNNLYFDTIFGVSGDRTAVPDATQPSGTVSYTQGYPIAYETPVVSGGLDFPRTPLNQIFYDITAAIQSVQQNGAPFFITTAMNGGVDPFSYILGAIVAYDGGSGLQVWVSTADDNDTIPGAGGAHWTPLNAPVSVVFTGGTSTGSANAQAVATANANFANTAGNIVTFKAGISGTGGATTLSVDTITNIPVKIADVGGLRDPKALEIVNGCEYLGVSDGTNIQILTPTQNFAAVIGDPFSQTLPSGLIMKGGTMSNTGGTTTLTFATAFPNAVISIQLTVQSGDLTALGSNSYASYFNAAASGFQWGSVNGGGAINTTPGSVSMKWLAIGH